MLQQAAYQQKKNSCFMVYDGVARRRFHLSGSRVNNYQKFVFSAYMSFTTWCAPFPDRNPGYGLGLCALFIAYPNLSGPCVFFSLKVGNAFVTSSYFQAKLSFVCCDFTQ